MLLGLTSMRITGCIDQGACCLVQMVALPGSSSEQVCTGIPPILNSYTNTPILVTNFPSTSAQYYLLLYNSLRSNHFLEASSNESKFSNNNCWSKNHSSGSHIHVFFHCITTILCPYLSPTQRKADQGT